MKPAYRGIAVAVLQCLMAWSVSAKYSLDRQRLPRVWAKAAPIDPNLPIRGRYLSIRLEVDHDPVADQTYAGTGHLTIRDGRLYVANDHAPWNYSSHVLVVRNGDRWTLMEPVAFFLPEHGADPSHVPAGKQLWAEVSVPPKGPPRPVRLEAR
ncbi:MAG TPA: hypothetical protein VMB03_05070 [Bryobacteraceae bacterium]|nr:hypothetical protein [Bryobacteraceae bacterium]